MAKRVRVTLKSNGYPIHPSLQSFVEGRAGQPTVKATVTRAGDRIIVEVYAELNSERVSAGLRALANELGYGVESTTEL